MNEVAFFTQYPEVSGDCGFPIYLEDEQSLSYVPFDHTADFTIMLGSSYIGLDVNSQTGLVSQISGFVPKHTWSNHELYLPMAQKGKLYAQLATPMIKGGGIRYGGEWPVKFCSMSKCLCIGNPMHGDQNERIQFCNGVIAELDNSKIISLWIALDRQWGRQRKRQGDG